MMMSSSSSCSEGEIKTQFLTREGIYRLMTPSEFPGGRGGSCSSGGSGGGRYGTTSGSGSSSAPGVRVSFVEDKPVMSFNLGRELFVYPYRVFSKEGKPLDKRVYRGTCPTCHDFGPGEEERLPLLVGFSGGQIQLIDPVLKELSQLYNEERLVDKTRVTCVKWVPSSCPSFLVSHASGNIYLYNRDAPSTLSSPPAYTLLKRGEGYAVYSQAKSGKPLSAHLLKNPIRKWSVGKGSVNEFSFSPCGRYLASVTQDGYLHVFNYDAMESVGMARSYFGGLLCVCWSPDGKYIACGGEDDLVTVYSFFEKKVVVRGRGHKSWVSVVAFDQYNMSYGELPDGLDFSGSDEEDEDEDRLDNDSNHRTKKSPNGQSSINGNNVTCYRFGSVGQDTYICLWDITEDILKGSSSPSSATASVATANTTTALNTALSVGKSNASSPNSSLGTLTNVSHTSNSNSLSSKDSGVIVEGTVSNHTSLSHRLASLNFGGGGDKKDKKISGASSSKSLSRSSSASVSGSPGGSSFYDRYPEESVKLGSPQCPRIYDTPVIEPLIIKKIAHERLTALVFREECLVTACQDGYVRTWARPGKMNGGNANVLCPESPPRSSTSSMCCNNLGSGSSSTGGDGTIV